jgi:L-ascorbate metabolism protein UlaG (beta-lactamase superfamily)
MSGMSQQQIQVAFAGHSTLLIELDGVKVLTDPLLRSSLLHLQRQAPPVDIPNFGGADVLLISHSHMDHLDKRSLRLVNREIEAIVPADCEQIIRSLGFRHVTGVRVGDEVTVKSVKFRAVHADHGGKRVPWHRESAITLGFVIEGSQSAYFAGDTDLFDEMAELHEQLDVAFVPVWGWGPKLGEGHLDPARAAEAVALINPRFAVPIHWGGYLPAGMGRRRPDLLRDPPREFRRLVESGPADTRVELIEPGGDATFDPAGGSQ